MWHQCHQSSFCRVMVSSESVFQVWDGVGGGRCLQTYSAHRGSVRDACWLSCGRRLLSGSFDGTAALTDVETGEFTFTRPQMTREMSWESVWEDHIRTDAIFSCHTECVYCSRLWSVCVIECCWTCWFRMNWCVFPAHWLYLLTILISAVLITFLN